MTVSPVTPAATGTPSTATNPLGTLSSNFNNFLQLLMTQLKNQDPTSPLDTNQFTSQLVQFTSVEQQINTNSSLTQLIQLTQAGEVMQSSGMIGKHVAVQSEQMPLQNGSGSLQFTTKTAQPVDIAIYNTSGVKVQEVSTVSNAGENTWTWNGKSSTGVKLPDGAYKITVTANNSAGTGAVVPFTVLGTATGVSSQGNGVQLQVGAVTVGFSAVQSVLN